MELKLPATPPPKIHFYDDIRIQQVMYVLLYPAVKLGKLNGTLVSPDYFYAVWTNRYNIEQVLKIKNSMFKNKKKCQVCGEEPIFKGHHTIVSKNQPRLWYNIVEDVLCNECLESWESQLPFCPMHIWAFGRVKCEPVIYVERVHPFLMFLSHLFFYIDTRGEGGVYQLKNNKSANEYTGYFAGLLRIYFVRFLNDFILNEGGRDDGYIPLLFKDQRYKS